MLLSSEIKPLPQRLLTGQERETQTSKLKVKRKGNEGAPSHRPPLPMSEGQKGQMTGKWQKVLRSHLALDPRGFRNKYILLMSEY